MSGGGDKVKVSRGEQTLAKLADTQLEEFKRRFIPIENDFLDRIRPDESDIQRAAGRSIADVTQQFTRAKSAQLNQSRTAGATASSGRSIMGGLSVANQQSRAASGLGQAAEFNVIERGRQGLLKATAAATGQKKASIGLLSGSGAAETSSRGAVTAADTAIYSANLGLLGSLAGAGAYGYMNRKPAGMEPNPAASAPMMNGRYLPY